MTAPIDRRSPALEPLDFAATPAPGAAAHAGARPLARDRSAAEKRGTGPGTAPSPAECPTPIVLVTAEPSLARMLDFAFEQLGVRHVTHSSGAEALRALLALPSGGRPPVVVLDADLPGMDGHALLERLGVARPGDFLVVVLSAHADESVQVRSLLAGAVDHMAKPFNVRVLMAKVQRWTDVARRMAASART